MFIEKANELLTKFCEREYDCRPDLSNLEKVGIAYTDTEDEMYDLYVEADLIHKELHYLVDSKLVNTEKYTEEEMLDLFSYMSFEGLTDIDNFGLENYE